MLFAMEPQSSRVNVSQDAVGLFEPSKIMIRDRKMRDATFFFEDNHERIIRARVPDVRVLLPPKQSFCCDKVGHQNNRKARPSSHYLVPSGFCPGGPHPSSHAMAHYSNASARKCALAFIGCPHVDYN